MSREWKPGDVGIDTSWGYRSIFVESCTVAEHGRAGGSCWHNESGLSDPPRAPRRPLVVIDAEDREQVERLLSNYHGWKWEHATKQPSITDMQAALREFASPTPPKPDEPQNEGAVVEDVDGHRWIRTSPIVSSHLNDWVASASSTHSGSDRRHWDGIAAVRVLSEGVSDA